MSDLISRSHLLEEIKSLSIVLNGKQIFSDYAKDTVLRIINEQPTAYSVDKVVEELEKELSLADKEKERCTGENNLQFDSAKGYASGISTAIEIVKQGGISEYVCDWKYNDSEYYWESSCEHLHIFMSDGPKENEYDFCPYCGKKIKVVE